MKRRIAIPSVLVSVFVAIQLGLSPAQASPPELRSTIVFSSTRDNPTGILDARFNAGEIYLIDPSTNPAEQHPRRLTDDVFGDAFANLSPDGKRIVFDRNAIRSSDLPDPPWVAPELFLMLTDGTAQTHLTRGSSATWSPDSRRIAFHASASGTGQPIKADPGAATSDSDIFVVNVGDLLDSAAQPMNITNSPQFIDDDPDWSPDGSAIVFTRHSVNDNPRKSTSAEIYKLRVDSRGVPLQDGLPNPQQLTQNSLEERAPAWSPDGTRIAYMCEQTLVNPPDNLPLGADFEICVMDADGGNQTRLTNNFFFDATPTWSPDGTQIVFQRSLGPGQGNQLYRMQADGTEVDQLTDKPGLNLSPHWGVVRTVGTPALPTPAVPQRRPVR
jgi:TolB protein